MKKLIEKIIEKLEEIQIENTCSDCPHKEKCDEVQENISDETTDLCGATIKALAIEIVKQEAEKYNNGWIPVRYHYITDEEREEGCISEDIVYWLDCKLPEDEEEILITRKWRDGYIVEHDMCMVDDGYYLDSGLDRIDVVAWQPLPKPFQPKGE